jgi:hypothetical protein
MQPAVSGSTVVNTILVAYNEQGWRIGETHHRSRISDAVVEKIRDLREYRFWTHREIADHFNISINTVKKICCYEIRIQRAERWKRVQVAGT